MNNLRKTGRFNYRTNKRYSYSRTNSSYAHNKRPKGNVSLLHDKYMKLAKEASSTGDTIQAEYYNQYADHYSRLMSENGYKLSNDEKLNRTSNDEAENKTSDNENISKDSKDVSNEDPAIIDQEKIKTSDKHKIKYSAKNDIEEEIDDNNESLETVSFISQPAKKTTKTTTKK